MNEKGKCKHCGFEIRTRNPSGYCDHLHYPDNCPLCKEREMIIRRDERGRRKEERRRRR